MTLPHCNLSYDEHFLVLFMRRGRRILFGLEGVSGSGIVVFNITHLESVVNDVFALGFVTRSDNGTLLILRSSTSSSRFFEIRLVG